MKNKENITALTTTIKAICKTHAEFFAAIQQAEKEVNLAEVDLESAMRDDGSINPVQLHSNRITAKQNLMIAEFTLKKAGEKFDAAKPDILEKTDQIIERLNIALTKKKNGAAAELRLELNKKVFWSEGESPLDRVAFDALHNFVLVCSGVREIEILQHKLGPLRSLVESRHGNFPALFNLISDAVKLI